MNLQSARMLLLDDDSFLRKFVKLNLPETIVCDEAETLDEAFRLYSNHSYNIVMVDLHLHKETGFKFIEEVNMTSLMKKPKIIVLTGSSLESEEVKCHQLEVTEFIRKPIRPTALKAQIEKNLQTILTENQDFYTVGPLHIYPRKSQVKVAAFPKDEDILLTSKEFMLLLKFLENPGLVMTREKLFQEVWDANSAIQSRTVDMHVSALRKKLGKYGEAICSVRGAGYKLNIKLLITPHAA